MKNNNNINMLNISHGEFSQKPAEKSEYFSFPVAEQMALPLLAATRLRCARCGSEFVRGGKRIGRPQSFCSDDCRKATVKEKRTRWIAEHGRSCGHRSNLLCRTCGVAFSVPATKSGRVPGYCSDQCKESALAIGKRTRRRRRLCSPGDGGSE